MTYKKKKQVIAYVHSHWDREWYREFEEFRLRLIEVFNRVLIDLQNGSLECFYFDAQTAALEDYLEIFPEKTALVKNLIKEKKLFIGPFFCSTDSLLTSAESMIRNLYLGIKKSQEFGCNDFIGYLSDTFGHSPCMTNILESFGIDKSMMWRGIGNFKSDLIWENILATNMLQGYFQDFLSLDTTIEKKAEYIKKYLKKIEERNSSDTLLLPIGADHLATPKNLKSQIIELNKYLDEYEIKIGTPFDYFEAVKDIKREKIEGELLDNSKTFILPGVYSSRIYLKQKNAKAQWNLSRIAEPLQSIAEFEFKAESRQNQLDYAYKTLIKNHAHDSIYGCGVDNVHKEVITRFEKIDQVSEGIKNRAIRDISEAFGRLTLINLSNFDYTGLIRVKTTSQLEKEFTDAVLISTNKGFSNELLYNISKIPVTEDYSNIYEYIIPVDKIPAMSIRQRDTATKQSQFQVITSDSSIENDFIKLKIKNKKICLTDKINNIKFNDFILISNRADIGDSYNFGALTNDTKIVADLINSKIIEKNKLFAKYKCIFKIKIPQKSTNKGRSKKLIAHKLELIATIEADSKNIKFEINWENKSSDHILQIEFKFPSKITKTISEDMLGTIERTFDPDFDIYKRIPAPRGIEIKPNTAPFQRFVWTKDVGFITKGLNEYEISNTNLALTLLRATGTISAPKNPTRGTPAGPPLPTPDLQCLGKNNAEFAICFTKNPNDLFKQSEEFYEPIVAIFSNVKEENILNIDNKNILIYAVKMSKFGLTYRLCNISNEPQSTIINSSLAYKKITELTPSEEKIKDIVNSIDFKPKEIKTIAFSK